MFDKILESMLPGLDLNQLADDFGAAIKEFSEVKRKTERNEMMLESICNHLGLPLPATTQRDPLTLEANNHG